MESNERIFNELENIKSPFRANAIKENEEDKWIITCGNIMALPIKFDTKEEAEKFIQINLPKPYTLMAVSALIVNVINIIEKVKEEEK